MVYRIACILMLSFFFRNSLLAQSNGVYYDLERALTEPQQVRVLDLAYAGLDSLPPEIATFSQLEKLVLSGNRIVILPKEIIGLRHLKNLVLDHNPTLNSIKLFELLEQIPHLQSLDLSACNLRVLSPRIGGLPELKYLNLSQNSLAELPAEFSKLDLNTLNLSENNLHNIEALSRMDSRLYHLFLSGNQEVFDGNTEQWTAIFRNVDSLTLQRLENFPEALMNVGNVRYLNLSKGRFSAFPEKVPKWENLRAAVFLDCDKADLATIFALLSFSKQMTHLEIGSSKVEQFPVGASFLKKLEYLKLKGSNWIFPPADLQKCKKLKELVLNQSPNAKLDKLFQVLGKMGGLKTLRLENCGFQTLPHNIHLISNLKNLDLSGNFLSDDVLDLCIAVLDETNVTCKKPITSEDESDPFNTFGHFSQDSKLIKLSTSEEILLESGTTIVNGSIDEKKDKPIEFHFRESKNVLNALSLALQPDMLNIPDGQSFRLESVFEMDANEQKFPDKIEIEWKAASNMLNLNLYKYDEASGRFFELGQDQLIKSTLPFQNEAEEAEITAIDFPEIPEPPSPLVVQDLDIRIMEAKKEFLLEIITEENELADDVGTKATRVKSFPELSDLTDITWKFDGTASKEASESLAMLTSFAGKKGDHPSSELEDIHDIRIEPDVDRDNYRMLLYLSSRMLVIPVYPLFRGMDHSEIDPYLDQKLNSQFYQNYYPKLKERMRVWSELDSLVVREMRMYEQNLEKYRTEIEQYSGMVAPSSTTRNSWNGINRRKITVSEPGTYLVGKETPVFGDEFNLILTDQNGAVLRPEQIIVVNHSDRVFTAFSEPTVVLDLTDENSIFTRLSDGRMAAISSARFRKSYKGFQPGTIFLEMEIFPAHWLNTGQLANWLELN